jgi:hypothetical protein
MGLKLKIKNGGSVWTDKTNVALDVGDAASVAGLSAKTDGGPGGFYRTTITLENVSQTVVNGTEYQGTKIYDFPECRMYVIGAVATLQQKTTSVLADTLNASSTGAIGVGTATASATTLATTMQDIIPTTAFTSSATINVAGTAVTAVLASPAVFDGTATAKDLYLNTAYATTGDVDADATQTISGTIVVTWCNLGDK